MLGDERHGAANGPQCYLDSGAAELLAAAGHDVTVERVARRERGAVS